MVILFVATACSSGVAPPRVSPVPPPPSTPRQRLGPSEPPVIWLGGVLATVRADHLELREGSGSLVRLQRLAGQATSFYRVAGSSWQRQADEAPVPAGIDACVETLLDGTTFVALRVFLGAGCGPD